MERLGGILLRLLPLIFAFGFLVPVLQQGLVALNWQPPFAVTPLTFALVVGGLWGLFASLKGRWV